MLIRNKKSKKTQQEDNLNRAHSTEGKKRAAEEQNLQASVQGGLSDLVRQSPDGVIDDEQAENYFRGLTEESEQAMGMGSRIPKNSKMTTRYVLRRGKLVPISEAD